MTAPARASVLKHFQRVWLVDFEYSLSEDDTPLPICMDAIELSSNELRRWWFSGLRELSTAPIDVGRDDLFVAYFASAEMGCFLQLGWPTPANVLDLYVEFRNATNGLMLPAGNGLLGALGYYGLPFMGAAQKEEMRALALRGGPWSAAERRKLLDYGQRDVEALQLLLQQWSPLSTWIGPCCADNTWLPWRRSNAPEFC
jgi:DNA polymerase-1